MLVVNNGVMKSGSVLLGQILMQTGEFVRDIGQFQNTRWNAVSVEKDRISEFLDGYNFRDSNVCLKMHCDEGPFVQRNDPNIKVITTFRNLKDSVVSYGHHKLKPHKNTDDRPVEYWTKDYFADPKRFGKTAYKFGLHYLRSRQYGSFMINFQDLAVDNKEKTMNEVYRHLGLSVSRETIEQIIENTNPKIKSKDDYKEGSHVRTGGISAAKDELPEMTYSQLDKLDKYLFSANTDIKEWRKICNDVISGKRLM